MKNFRYLALLALLALPLAACDDAEEAPVVTPPVEGTIRGTVTLEGQAAQGITVTLQGGAAARTATTNSNGGFEFTAVSAGGYQVEISNIPAGAAFSPTSRAAVISSAGQQVTVDFAGQFIRTSSIVGSVTASGVGQAGVTVSLTGTGAAQTTSNAQGAFSFTGLRAGTYTVAISGTATGTTFSTVSQNVTVGVGQAATVGFAGTLPAPDPKPATVTIASITQGTLNTPVILGNAAGQLDVTVNIVPNDESPTKIAIFVGNTEVASQTIANAAPSEGAEESTSVQQVTLSFNSALYNRSGSTATPVHLNGAKELRARLTVAQRPATEPRASNAINVVFNNLDGFHHQHVIGNPAASAVAANGSVWYGGPDFTTYTYSVIPVSYSGRAVKEVTLAGTCAAGTGEQALRDEAAPFSWGRACAAQQGGVSPSVGAAVYSDGTPHAGTGVITNASDAAREAAPVLPVNIDRVAPAGAAIVIATQTALGNIDNWVNGTYSFVTGYTAPTDAGVGISTTDANVRAFQVRTAGDTAIVAGHDFSDNVQTAAGLTDSVDPTRYQVRVRVRDLLNNSTVVVQSAGASPNTLATFGVDKVAPAVQNNASPADSTVQATASGNFSANFADGLSGFAGTGAVLHNLVKVTGSTSGIVTTALAGTGVTTAKAAAPFATAAASQFITTTPAAAAYTPSPTLITITPVAVPAAGGYVIYQAQAQDKAGNRSDMFTRRLYVDHAQSPVITGLNATATYSGGSPASFPAVAQDSVEVVSGELLFTYPNVGVPVIYPRPTPLVSQTFNDDGFTMPAAVNYQVPLFIRGIQVVETDGSLTGSGMAFATARPNQVGGRVFNPLSTLSTFGFPEGNLTAAAGRSSVFFAPILSTQIAAGTDFATVATATKINSFTVSAPTCAAATTGTNPTQTCTWTVKASGQPGTFVNPFAALAVVEGVNPANGLRVVYPAAAGGVAPANASYDIAPKFTAPFPTLDNGVVRDYEWTLTITRRVGSGTFAFHVVGVAGGFDALASTQFTRTW